MKLVQTECMTWFALIWFVGGYGWKNKNKFFSLYYTQFALTLFHEVRLHFGSPKIKTSFSLCTTLSLH